MKNVNWPHVALAAIAVGGLLGTLALILALTPAPLLDRMVDANWPAAITGAVSLAISVVVMLRRAGLWKDVPPPGGSALALLGVLALGGTLAGCGASPLRQHATAASTAMATMASAGVAIVGAERAALAACPDADGPERSACIDRVEHAATAAAASRDALIPLVHGYRDAVEDAAENAEPSPTLLGVFETMGVRVFREIDVMREAIEALAALAQGGV